MSNTTFQINAADTLFFRDGKPFSMGDETWAKGIFPPFPSTVYGMLRSVYFARNMDTLNLANNEGDPTSNFILNGFLPTLNGEPVFPIPNDIYGFKRQPNRNGEILQFSYLSDKTEFISDYELGGIMQTRHSEKIEELGGKAFLTKADFEKYLNGIADSFSFEKAADYLTDEPKIGIGRAFETRTASEGKLYRVAMKRLKGEKGEFGFILKFSNLDIKSKVGLSRFGAESKAIYYSEGSFPDISIPDELDSKKLFKIYLSTPAIFPEGNAPYQWFKDHNLTLLAGVTGRKLQIGGFDLKKRKPKPMRQAVSAGTVYYVEATDLESSAKVIQKLHQGSIYNIAPPRDSYKEEYQKQGFGLTYTGQIKLQNS